MKSMEKHVRVATLAAVVLVAATLWGCAAKQDETSPQRVAIAVTDDGFVPKQVTVHAGRPVTLVVTRKSDRTCATELVMEEENIRQPLPMNQPVEITFTPDKKGDLTYACGMDMIKGQIAVR